MNKKTSLISNRMIHYDLMRVIACFCVIMIHVGICNQIDDWGNSSISLMFSHFYGILSRWAVPCFVMISGIMFLNKNKEIPIKKLYSKYILRLFVSYAFWSCVYALYNSFYETGSSISEKISYFINNCLSGEIHMWYVLMTIGLYIAMPVIKHIINSGSDKLIRYWLIIMFVFASLIPFISDLNIPFISGIISYLNQYINIQFLCGYTLYFVIGYYLTIKEISPKMKNAIYILGLIGFIYSCMILIVGRYFFNISLGALDYLYPNIIFMSIAIFVFFKDVVSKVNFKPATRNIIFSLSKLTYGIFLIHVLILKVLYHLGFNLSICTPPISMLIVTVVTFIVSAVIILPISKIPFINKYIC